MLLNCGIVEDSWESLGLQEVPTSPSWRRSVLAVHWKDWCWSWNSNTLGTRWEEPTHWKRPLPWDRLKAEGKEGDRWWVSWMASVIQRTWPWANFWRWWGTRRPGMLQSIGSQERDTTEWLNWTELNWRSSFPIYKRGVYLSRCVFFKDQHRVNIKIPVNKPLAS